MEEEEEENEKRTGPLRAFAWLADTSMHTTHTITHTRSHTIHTRSHPLSLSHSHSHSHTPTHSHTHSTVKEKSRGKTHKKRASQLTANWKLPDDYRDYCKTKRPDLCPDATAENFKDYHLGHGKPMVDWKATWRNWVRREHGTNRKESNGTGGGSLQTPQSRNKAALERKRQRASGEAMDAPYSVVR